MTTDFNKTKALFHVPDGVTYLNGNSLGPMPKAAMARAASVIADEWGALMITAWNKAGWMALPEKVGNRIAPLIGAPQGSVVVGDTLTIKVYQALAAALEMNPARKVILSDNGNFPTDLYMAQGLIGTLKQGHELRVVDPQDVAANIGPDIAVMMLTHVDYRSGRMHDMAALTAAAHAAGIVVIWDLAHTAGAMPVDIAGCQAEFAVGCTYKYLNGGPGAPAFIYVRPDLIDHLRPALSGWLGHDAPFAFDLDYRPGAGISRLRVGTPPIIQMSILDAALDAWDGVDLDDLRAASIALTGLFITEVEQQCQGVTLVSPRDAALRGSQVSFQFEHGYQAIQALIARGVVGDFRAPDVMRFGFTPLFIGADDVRHAASVLADVVNNRGWDWPEFQRKGPVT